MSLDIQIKVDPGAAIPSIDKVGAGLAKLEAQGPTVGEAISRGMRESSSSAEKLKTSTQGVVDQLAGMAKAGAAFGGLTDQFRREADMLEKIRGPMREYEQGQQSLEMLYRKNLISAKEYTDQVEKLNASISRTPKEEHEGFKAEGSVGRSVAGQFGEAGNVAAGIAGGTLEIAGVVGLGAEVIRLGDEYTTLANKAVRFADSEHDVNTILGDQMNLSRDIHGGLEQTVELYTQIREGTDELNYSYRDQITVTKSLAEEVQLSGKGLDQASGLMQRLAFAFESGTLTSRELKGMLRDFPALGETLRESFGKTSAELMDMAKHGTLAPQMILDALIEKAPEIEERFGKMAETSAQKWGHFKDEATLAIGGSLPSLDQMVHKLAELEPPEVRATKAMDDFKKKVEETLTPTALVAAHLQEIANKARENATYAAISEKGAAAELERMKAEAAARKDAIYDREVKKAAADALAAYNKEMTEEQKILDEVYGTTKEAEAGFHALDELLRKHIITTAQYNAELDKMNSKHGDPAMRKLIDDAVSEKQPKDKQLQSETKQRAEQAVQDNYWDKADSLTALQKWSLEIEQLNRFYAEGGHTLAEYRKKKTEIDDEFRKNQYTKDELQNQKMMTESWKLEIDVYKKHVSEMENALKPLEQAFVTLAKTGKFEWGTMLDSMESMLIQKLSDEAFKQLAGFLTSAIFGSGDIAGSPGILPGGSHATGGDYTAPSGGGTDSHAVMFRMSPGETAHFTPREQQQAGQSGNGSQGGQQIVFSPQIVNQHDTRGELLAMHAGGVLDTPIINVMRRNLGAVRSLLK